MTPLQFLSFRSSLEAASGFQSAQFRELEFILGHKRPAIVRLFAEGSPERARLERRLHEPSVWSAVLHLLARSGYPVPSAELNRDVTKPAAPSPAVQRLLIEIYQHDVTLTQVCERLIDLDEIIQEWRYRHIKMVERTIGTKAGSGGSTGAGYLRATLFSPLFPDLWAIRGEL
jgi:tryptophan 2,3-dioxygenase